LIKVVDLEKEEEIVGTRNLLLSNLSILIKVPNVPESFSQHEPGNS
jgi:hypothetical protein